jgi:hypothetical protein
MRPGEGAGDGAPAGVWRGECAGEGEGHGEGAGKGAPGARSIEIVSALGFAELPGRPDDAGLLEPGAPSSACEDEGS